MDNNDEKRDALRAELELLQDEENRDAELERLQAHLEKVRAATLSLIQELAMHKPAVLARLMCEVVLGTPSDGNFLVNGLEPDDLRRLQSWYGDVAAAMITKLDENERKRRGDPIAESASDFISLKEWITNQFFFPNNPSLATFTSPARDRLIDAFFESHEDSFAYGLSNACDMIFTGIPLYEQQDSGELSPIPFTHEDYVYLSKKGELSDISRTSRFPPWAARYFMKREHLAKHAIFFPQGPTEPNKEAAIILRSAFRQHIGFEGGSSEPEDGSNKQQQKAVQARWKRLEPVKQWAREQYASGQWSSRAACARAIEAEVRQRAERIGERLTPTNVVETITGWLPASE